MPETHRACPASSRSWRHHEGGGSAGVFESQMTTMKLHERRSKTAVEFVAADSTQSALISHAVALFLVGDVNHCLGSTVLASYRQRRQVRRRDSEYRMFGHWRFPLP